MKLKRVGVISLSLNMAIYLALLGLLLGVMIALFSTIGGGLMEGAEGAGMLAGMGLMSIVLFPIIYGVFGFIGGLIGALFFNLALKVTGGLDLDFQ